MRMCSQTWAVDKDVIDAGELNSLTQPQQNDDSAKQQETSEHVYQTDQSVAQK